VKLLSQLLKPLRKLTEFDVEEQNLALTRKLLHYLLKQFSLFSNDSKMYLGDAQVKMNRKSLSKCSEQLHWEMEELALEISVRKRSNVLDETHELLLELIQKSAHFFRASLLRALDLIVEQDDDDDTTKTQLDMIFNRVKKASVVSAQSIIGGMEIPFTKKMIILRSDVPGPCAKFYI